jgi:2-dehydro-3-deoxyphosphogluconate aldolase / (4S)-4-hydroxy-2-oxoglutarate aldolase
MDGTATTTRIADPREVMALGPFIPVVTIDEADHAAELARALLAGGIRTVEVTLRTPQALDAIHAIAAQVPEIVVGAGTLLGAADVTRARKAGARFGVSPGLTQQVAEAARGAEFPLLPGAVTASEIMTARERGFTALKFFPAKAAGGLDALKNFVPVFPDVVFCPTGGIGQADAPQFLALPNVLCYGGAWVASPELVRARDWQTITANARLAAAQKKA